MTCKYCGDKTICRCAAIKAALNEDPEVIGKIAEDTLTEQEIDDLICSLRDARYAVQMRKRLLAVGEEG